MTATVRFGLIGCGMIARLHAGAIREIPGAELGGAFDPVPGRAEAFMNEQGGKPYPSVEALLADPAIDAVCICTPSGTHAELARAKGVNFRLLQLQSKALSVRGLDNN